MCACVNENSRRRIPIPRKVRIFGKSPQLLHLLLAQLDVDGPRILLEVLDGARAGNGNKILPLGGHPGQTDLRGRGVMSFGHDGNLVHEGLDLEEVVWVGELGHLAAEVVGAEVVEGLDGAGEEAAADGAVGDDGDAELATGLEDGRLVGLDV